MATEKNITMKQFNGTDYDTLYPKTIASQIPDVYSKSYIDNILKDNAKIQTGSYVGTGTHGSDNPCTLTFDKMPVLVAIDTGSILNKDATCPPFVKGCAYTNYCSGKYSINYGIDVKWTDNSISWYSSNDNTIQMNLNNVTYYYVAITI